MSLKKHTAILLLIVCCTAFTHTPGNTVYVTEKWVILKDCKVSVNGSTNINRFSCSIPEYLRTDTLTCSNDGSNEVINLTGKLSLPVISFDCVNKLITSDLRKTLKAKEFPSLNIYFLSLEKYPDVKGQGPVRGTVNIELAGVSKKIIVNYLFSIDEHKIISLVGTQNIRFSDFMLAAPRKLGGMIRTDDQLTISFTMHFRRISNGS